MSEIELNLYSVNSTMSSITIESAPFLTNLDAINRTSFQRLLDQIIDFFKDEKPLEKLNEENKEIMFKLLVCIAINGNDFISNTVMRELLQIPVRIPREKKELNYGEWPVVLKFRQEVNSFHAKCLRESVKSLTNYLLNDLNQMSLYFFIQNLCLIYSWDLRNKNNMRQLIFF